MFSSSSQVTTTMYASCITCHRTFYGSLWPSTRQTKQATSANVFVFFFLPLFLLFEHKFPRKWKGERKIAVYREWQCLLPLALRFNLPFVHFLWSEWHLSTKALFFFQLDRYSQICYFSRLHTSARVFFPFGFTPSWTEMPMLLYRAKMSLFE